MPKTISSQDWKSLQAVLPQGAVLTNPIELIPYEVDGSLGQGAAQGVILARSTEDVARIVRWAAERGLPVIARGAGTGLSGGAVAPHGGVILSVARMKQIVEFDEAGRSVVVQPGIVHLTLDEFVKTKGLYYPPDPASGRACTIGGNLAENAGGPHCFKYGVTTNYVNGLKVVLADGRVLHTGGRAFDYPEYDLTGLLVGSEGTLGIITEAELRLVRNIPGIKTLMAIFNSVEEAGEAVSAVIAGGLVPATLEMMDRTMIGIVENYVHAGLPTDAEALLIIEADGYPESIEPQMAEIMAVLRERQARELRLAQNAAERDRIWFARKSAFGAIAQISPAYLIVDGTVPRSKLAATLAEINQICARHDLRVGYVFHAGDGNLHPLILFDPQNPDMVRRVHLAGPEVMKLCVDQGGTISGEHGVGSEKLEYMKLMYDAGELQAMRDIKQVFDPNDILNPGKIIPAEPVYVKAPHTPKADLPLAAAPASIQEASELLKDYAAARKAVGVRIRGGGTKSSLLPPADAVIATHNLVGILEYAVNDLYVHVRAGTRLSDLQAELAKEKMWVPLASPWTESTVGGIVAANFNAPLRMRYGSLRDLILAVTVVLPDGRTVRAGRPVVKNVAGYDVGKVLIGSHGTLGLITDVIFKLSPFPRARSTMIAPIENLGTGLKVGAQLLRMCLASSALLLCRGCELPGITTPYALVYTAEGVPEDVRVEFGQVARVLRGEGLAVPEQCDGPSGSEVWGGWVNRAAHADMLIRLGVPPKDLVTALVDVAPTLDTRPFIADLAYGMVWTQGGQLDVLRGIARSIGGYAMALSAPQGPDATRFDPWGYAPEGLDLMRRLKARWDPTRYLNPAAFIV